MKHLPLWALCAVAAWPASTWAAEAALPSSLADWSCTGHCGSSAAQGDVSLSPLANPLYGYVATSGSDALGVSPVTITGGSRGSDHEENGSRWLSPAFTASAGDLLNMRFNYVSTDGKGFDDYGWARIVNAADNSLVAWIFTAQSNNGSTGKIVPGDVVDKSAFDPGQVIVNYKDFVFNTRNDSNPIDWAPLGLSNGSCWRTDAEGCGFTGWLQSRHTFAGTGSFRVELGVVNYGDEAYDSGLAFDFAGLAAPVPEPAPWALLLLGGGLLARRVRRSPGA